MAPVPLFFVFAISFAFFRFAVMVNAVRGTDRYEKKCKQSKTYKEKQRWSSFVCSTRARRLAKMAAQKEAAKWSVQLAAAKADEDKVRMRSNDHARQAVFWKNQCQVLTAEKKGLHGVIKKMAASEKDLAKEVASKAKADQKELNELRLKFAWINVKMATEMDAKSARWVAKLFETPPKKCKGW